MSAEQMTASAEEELIDKDILAYLKRHESKELLRFVIVGSVDDGKSTLIGRLLFELQAVYEDQLEAVRKATTMVGVPIDFSLITTKLDDQLDRTIPSSGPCVSAEQQTGACTAPEERLADTFAKWALRGAVSLAGAGYGVASPASLEDWGAPLADLAIEIDVASRD